MRTKLTMVLAAILAAGVTACSSDGAEPSGKPSASVDVAKINFAPFVVAADEEPGYKPVGAIDTDTDAGNVAAQDNLTADDLPGFAALAYRQIAGSGDRVGVSSVALFHDVAGAQSYWSTLRDGLEKNMAGWTVRRFDVTAVPQSFGYTGTATDRHVGNVVWVEGRCVVTLGNETKGALEPSLTTGSENMHERINGNCPLATDAGAARPMWPAPATSRVAALAHTAGLRLTRKELLDFHRHSHLDVFVDGSPVLVPGGIGIRMDDAGVLQFPLGDGTIAYGGIELCDKPCISPLHTHDPDGVLHTESKDGTRHKLGQFFVEWGVLLTTTCVGKYCEPKTSIAFYLNGAKFTGDPGSIVLEDDTEIALVIGDAPETIPSVFSGEGA